MEEQWQENMFIFLHNLSPFYALSVAISIFAMLFSIWYSGKCKKEVNIYYAHQIHYLTVIACILNICITKFLHRLCNDILDIHLKFLLTIFRLDNNSIFLRILCYLLLILYSSKR